MTLPSRTVVYADAATLAEVSARALERMVAARTAGLAETHLVVTGGRIGTALLANLDRPPAAIDWQRVHLWWGDERFLPAGHPDRNATQAERAFVGRSAIAADHVHVIPARSASTPDCAVAARAYAAELGRYRHLRFDLVLLSLGPDGHVASLFPGRPEWRAAGVSVPVVDAPKPPPERVSLTLPRLLDAQEVWLLVAGADKREALTQAMREANDSTAASPASSVLRCPRTRLLVTEDALPAPR